jgi:hypothetical protein
LSNIHGTNVPGYEIKLHPRFIIAALVLLVEQVMQANGVINGDRGAITTCKTLMIYFIAIQLVVKLVCRFVNDDDALLLKIEANIIKFYAREQKIIEHRAILNSKIEICGYLMKVYAVFSLVNLLFPTMVTLLTSWYYGEFYYLAEIYLPCIDHSSLFGFLLNSSIFTVCSFILYLIFAGADLVCVYGIYQTVPMVEIFELKMIKLAEQLKAVDGDEDERKDVRVAIVKLSRTQKAAMRQEKIDIIERQLINLIEEFNDYDRFIKNILVYMKFYVFSVVMLNALAMGISLVTIVYSHRANGGALLLFFTNQVLFACVQGTLVSHQNGKMLDAVCSFPWYELSTPKQKIYLQFIHVVQNATKLTIPIFGDLNMEVFSDIMNRAYSYLMMISRIINI